MCQPAPAPPLGFGSHRTILTIMAMAPIDPEQESRFSQQKLRRKQTVFETALDFSNNSYDDMVTLR
jgi:hypothetical protein